MKSKLWMALAILVFIMNANIQAFLKASGTEIVDANGTPVLLRGYGLGGWLVPEGYMLHTPGYGSPTDIYNKIVDVIGVANAEMFYAAYTANYVNRKDIEIIAGWGFNSVRMPFHYKLFYDPANGTFQEDGFALLDSLLDWSDDNGMYVILDMHCAPGGQNSGNISDSDGTARLWTEPHIYQPMTIKIWQEIARRYKDDVRVGGYDLINEPVLPDGYTNAVLREFFVELTDSIRQIDQNHILFIEGNWYATNFDQLTPPWDSNMAYSFHKYWNETNVATIQGYLSIRTQHNVPLWLGETGENSNGWFYETVRMLEANNVGWNWWTHKKVETITSPYSAKYPAGYQALLNYWSGSGSKPSPGAAFTTLMALAENLKIDNCEYRPGVIPALTDPDFGTIPKPFKNHNLPGLINAVDYDFGSQGTAYIDQSYKRTQGLGGPDWNSGYAYRNDGVDIERSQDSQGFGYNVGWIDTGERMMYTVNIATNGFYQGHFRVASNGGNGLFTLLLDGQSVTGLIDVPNTGGWQNWTNIVVDSIHLTAGTHQLMFLVPRGGFNFNRMTFFLTAVGIADEGNAEVPESFKLHQNYPNPFNPVTKIAYEVPKPAEVNLIIYNILGEKIHTLVSAYHSAGSYTAELDGSDLESGVYFCRLETPSFSQTRKMILLK